ncbi:MAG: hypothetical protein KME48_16875 [Candidatus Thiodiazotropha sp. (ex Ctena orbiculata)]|nr:hypothetical protein [Candidatus Thiodiazotropha taylori]
MTGSVSTYYKKGHGIPKVSGIYRNLAAALMAMKSIPEGKALIGVFGSRNEYSTQRAIESWLMSYYSEYDIRKMCSPLDTLGDALIHFLNERLNSGEGGSC